MALVALIDYGSGNLRSAEKALMRAADMHARGWEICVTGDPSLVAMADAIVLPGVGAFADCMGGLRAVSGMAETLREAVLVQGTPFLGICVGMQLLAGIGREFGDHPGLNWIGGDVVRLTPSDPVLKIPHIGWNELVCTHPHPLLDAIEPGAHVYFVHSYAMRPTDPAHTLATCDYGGVFCAVAGRDNIVGTQFHPEKSQAVGLRILGNFLNWRPDGRMNDVD